MKKSWPRFLPPLPVCGAVAWSLFVAYHFLARYLASGFAGIRGPCLVNPIQFFDLSGYDKHFAHAGWALLGGHCQDILLALLFFISAYGWGALIMRTARIGRPSAGEEVIYRIALGSAAASYFILAVGWLGLLYKGVIVLFLLVGLIAAAADIKLKGFSFPGLLTPAARRDLYPYAGVFLFLPALTLFFSFIAMLAPESFVDSMRYLTLPVQWLRQHEIATSPYAIISYQASNAIYLYTIGLAVGAVSTAKLLSGGFGLLTLAAIYSWTRKRFGDSTALVATAIFLSVPFSSIVMTHTSPDTFVIFFETAALFCFLDFADTGRRQRLLLSAVFCGTAIGARWLSACTLVAIFILIVIDGTKHRKPARQTVSAGGTFVTVSFLFIAPFLIRNYLRTGMPLYPFDVSFANSITCSHHGRQDIIKDPAPARRNVQNLTGLIWDISMGDSARSKEPYAGATVLLLLPLAMLVFKSRGNIKYLALFSALYYCCWFMICNYFRYLLPALPALSIALAALLMSETTDQRIRTIFLSAFVPLAVLNLLFTVKFIFVTMNPWPVVSGTQSKDEYLSVEREQYENPAYGVVAWANEHLAPGAKILFLGDARALYCQRQFVFCGISDTNPLVLLLRKSGTAAEFHRLLRLEGITYLLLNGNEELAQRRDYGYGGTLNLGEHERSILKQFWQKYIVEDYRSISDISVLSLHLYSIKKQAPDVWAKYAADPNNFVYLYRVLSDLEAEKPHLAPKLLLSSFRE